VLWLGAWLLEAMARVHFHRALRHAHEGFAYDPGSRPLRVPRRGELLTLQTYDDRNKLAIYKAPASSCSGCVLKAFCTPARRGAARLPLAGGVRGDRHRAIPRVALVLLLARRRGVRRVGGDPLVGLPGEGLFLIALMLSLIFLWLDVRGALARTSARSDLGRRGVSRWRRAFSIFRQDSGEEDEVERRFVTVEGNEAAALIAHQTNEVIAIYPITPASPDGGDGRRLDRRRPAEYLRHGPRSHRDAERGGRRGHDPRGAAGRALATTFTASQGLLLMIPNMFKIAGS
jgi:hypothetical protein